MWTWRRFLYEIHSWLNRKNHIDYTNCFNASAYGNGDFISIETYIAGGFTCDPNGIELFFEPTETADTLGKGIRKVLSLSHDYSRRESNKLFNRESTEQRYQQWIAQLMGRFGYKTKRALFKDMMSCSISQKDDVITINPSWHEKLEAWSGGDERLKPEHTVTLPADCSDEELGQGLRLAFSRCWPKTPWVKALMAEFDEAAQAD